MGSLHACSSPLSLAATVLAVAGAGGAALAIGWERREWAGEPASARVLFSAPSRRARHARPLWKSSRASGKKKCGSCGFVLVLGTYLTTKGDLV